MVESHMPDVSPYEESVIAYRSNPAFHEFARKNYLDVDLGEAVSRYLQSEEFLRICNLLRPYLSPHARWLDIGAGRGLTSFALTKLGAHITAVEMDSSDVVGIGALSNHLRHNRTRLCAVRADILCLPFASSSFNAVFCRSTLHHLVSLEQGLREIYRVLKPDGVFLALNEHILALFSSGKTFLLHHPSVSYGVNENAYHALTYWWKLRQCGFRHIQIYGYPLEFADFVKVTQENWFRAKLIALPGVGGGCAHLLHRIHLLVRRYLRVPEETLPAISIVAQKIGNYKVSV